jgi:DNA sulfur modification protein DndB
VSRSVPHTSECVHSFAAIRGVQAGREYFVISVPLRMLPTLFRFDDPTLPPDQRAQRVVNTARVPAIATYLIENPRDYVMSALTASVDQEVRFEPGEVAPNAGILHVPMGARLLVNDGQHRRAAIAVALEDRPELGDETLPVTLFLDAGLTRSQQIFADLNRYALKPSRSLNVLFDQRDPVAGIARALAQTVDPFRGFTEFEKTSLSHRSRNVFTLSSIYQGVSALLRRPRLSVDAAASELAIAYWGEIGTLIREWGFVDEIRSAHALRSEFIHTHAVAIHALGVAGAALVAAEPHRWPDRLRALGSLNWSRSNTALWEGRAVMNGRITKAGNCVALTANALKRELGLALTDGELALERLPTRHVEVVDAAA